MNRKVPDEEMSSLLKSEKLRKLVILLSVCLCLFGSVRSSSLWIDEGQTWSVLCGDWNHLTGCLSKRGDAVSGMPLYFIVNYGVTRLTGLSEYAMRSLNLLFGTIYLMLAAKLLKKLSLPPVFLLLFAADPVFLYYMNEARPYVILLTLGTVLALLLYACDMERTSVIAGIYAVLWLGAATHMMFVFSGLTYLTQCFFEWRAGKLNWKRHLICGVCFIPLFLPLFLHYFWVLSVAPEVRSFEPGGLKSLLQITYSFLGFTGLGFSRNDMRGAVLSRFNFRMAAETAAAVLAYSGAFFLIVRHRLKPQRSETAFRIFCGTALAGGAFVVANLVLGTRFWERHVIWLLPMILLLSAMYIRRLYAERGFPAKCIAVLWFAVIVISGLNIMLLPYYQKDDYRAAARAALQASRGGPILFQGDRMTFKYYGLDSGFRDGVAVGGGHMNISNIDAGRLEVLCGTVPRTIILSEKREFDARGLCRTFRPGAGIAVNSFRIIPPGEAMPGKPSGSAAR